MLVTDDGIVMDVKSVAFWKALTPMLVYVSIRALVAPYNNAVALVNDPFPLNTLVSHDTVIPDFPYSVLPVPGMTLGIRLSSSVDSWNMAVVILESPNTFVSIVVTEAGMVMDVNLAQPLKYWAPDMLAREAGSVIFVKLLQ